jgi:xylulokinase
LESIGLNPEKLARPLPSGRIAGKVNPGIAADLGLAEHAFVVVAGHDQPCAALGAGVVKDRMAIYTLGTVECITPAFSKPVFSEQLRKNNFCTYDHTVEGMYATLAYSLTGGNILKWFRNEFGAYEMKEAERTGADPYDLIIAQMDKKPTDLMVLPYFTPSGTPYFDTVTRGAIVGLRLSTKRGVFIRALLEGVALEMRLNLEILESAGYRIDVLRIVGGGAKSKALSQMKADVIGKKVEVPDVSEAGCFGTAMLAFSAYAGRPVTELADQWVSITDEIAPNPEFSAIYAEKFEEHKKLYQKIRELFS